jgi:uncharacterized iron-regulated protein
MTKLAVTMLGFGLGFSISSFAGTFYDGATGAPVSQAEILSRVTSGAIVIASELHDHEAHHQNQRDLLTALSKQQEHLSVGMEFFSYPDQSLVNDYVEGRTDEKTFLQKIKWDGGLSLLSSASSFLKNFAFDFYRFQVQFPATHGGHTLALNFPRELSGKVARGGLEALSDEEARMIPPDFEKGSITYFERFYETMKGHAKEEQIQNYFTAQSLWDDTMAWQATKYMSDHSGDVLMIIVGDFHVAYQDGLVARLKARGAQNIISISQVDTTDFSESERRETIEPSSKYGSRADYVFDSRKLTQLSVDAVRKSFRK